MNQILQSVYTGNIKYINQTKGLVMFTNQLLGQGSNGQIYKGQVGFGTTDAIDVAVKIFEVPQRDEVLKQQLSHEITILSSLEHQNIAKFYDAEVTQNNFYIFMELCSGKTLQDLIELPETMEHPEITKCLPEDQVLRICSQLIDAIYYLSQVYIQMNCKTEGIAHRDLKPDNIMMPSNIPKIIDFGLARSLEANTVTNFRGTPYYMSPQNIGYGHYNPEKNDVWSMGVIIYQLLHGTFPWRREVFDENDLLLAHNTMVLKFNDNVSPGLQDLIRDMLKIKEENRPQWKDIIYSYPVFQPYLGKNVKSYQILDTLLEMYNVYQSYRKQTKYHQLDKSIIQLSIYCMTIYRNLIGKNTKLMDLYDQLLTIQIQYKPKQQTVTYLRLKLKNKIRTLISLIYRQDLTTNESYLGLLRTALFWTDNVVRSADENPLVDITIQ